MITRDNYEEFLLLYLDSELSASERKIVELFIAENPDLREELESLQQCRISPDTHLFFEGKDELLRREEPSEGRSYAGNSLVNDGNYEEYFLSFIDGELNEEERKAVANYTNQHPSRLRELMRLQHAVSTPDHSVVFANKEILYRKTTDRRILALPWLRVAAAAAVILVIGWFYFSGGQRHTSSPLAKQSQPLKNDSGVVTINDPATFNKVQAAPAGSAPAIAAALDDRRGGKNGDQGSGNKSRSSGMKEKMNEANAKNETKHEKVIEEMKHSAGTNDHELLAMDTKQGGIVRIAGTQGREDNTVLSPDQIAAMAPGDMAASGNKALAQNERQLAVITGQGEISRQNSSFASQALLNGPDRSTEDDDAIAASSSQKKNKLRGIFRKVSRVFEKTSNVDDDKHGILIGNFQVALK